MDIILCAALFLKSTSIILITGHVVKECFGFGYIIGMLESCPKHNTESSGGKRGELMKLVITPPFWKVGSCAAA